MKILITGAAGFLGQGLIESLTEHHELRLMDVEKISSSHDSLKGSVENLDKVRQAMKGMDALIIAHMAPRSPDSYVNPPICFEINVTGTANLFFAAQEVGIRRVVLISSVGTVYGYKKNTFHDGQTTARCFDLYSLTKVCQETVAEQYHHLHSMEIAVLRVGHIIDGKTMVDKYGTRIENYTDNLTDRKDIGEVCRLALEKNDLQFEIFYVIGSKKGWHIYDVATASKQLNWKPKYDFEEMRK